jgi:hypothetical protein
MWSFGNWIFFLHKNEIGRAAPVLLDLLKIANLSQWAKENVWFISYTVGEMWLIMHRRRKYFWF